MVDVELVKRIMDAEVAEATAGCTPGWEGVLK